MRASRSSSSRAAPGQPRLGAQHALARDLQLEFQRLGHMLDLAQPFEAQAGDEHASKSPGRAGAVLEASAGA
jgi:hypothetical protein